MHPKILIVGMIIAALSALHLIFPRFCLRFGNVWKFEGDVEPTPEAIYIIKFIAVIFLIIGVLLVVYGGFFDGINEFLGLSPQGWGILDNFRITPR